MEVILREHIDNLGRRGEVVKVANGYARNFLLPRKMALAVTEANKRQIEREREAAEARDLEEKSQAEAYGQRLSQTEVEIARRVGENNTLYGSVTSHALCVSPMHAQYGVSTLQWFNLSTDLQMPCGASQWPGRPSSS